MPHRSRYYKPMPKYRDLIYENHNDFLHRQLTVADLVGGDPRYAYIKAALYFIFAPYLTGGLVLLSISVQGRFSDLIRIMQEGDLLSYFMVWAVGYEILASMFLIWVFYTLFNISRYQHRRRIVRRYESSDVTFGS